MSNGFVRDLYVVEWYVGEDCVQSSFTAKDFPEALKIAKEISGSDDFEIEKIS